MNKGKLLLRYHQWVVIVTIIIFIGLVIFNAFTGELSQYTAEQLANRTFMG